MQQENQKPDVEEQYTAATNTSNLRVELDADRRSQADILMAAAWSPSRLGAALLRLHSEWDAAEHPKPPTGASILAIANAWPPVSKGDKVEAGRRLVEARTKANQWYRHEMAILLGKLKMLPEVRDQLSRHAEAHGIADGAALAAEVIQWWLDRLCKSCNGTKFEVITGTGRQSGRACKVCKGRGESFVPQFESGRWLASYMDDSVNRARQQIRGRLNNTRLQSKADTA